MSKILEPLQLNLNQFSLDSLITFTKRAKQIGWRYLPIMKSLMEISDQIITLISFDYQRKNLNEGISLLPKRLYFFSLKLQCNKVLCCNDASTQYKKETLSMENVGNQQFDKIQCLLNRYQALSDTLTNKPSKIQKVSQHPTTSRTKKLSPYLNASIFSSSFLISGFTSTLARKHSTA